MPHMAAAAAAAVGACPRGWLPGTPSPSLKETTATTTTTATTLPPSPPASPDPARTRDPPPPPSAPRRCSSPMASPAPARADWSVVPAPVRGLFNLFPLRVYGSEALPVRAPAVVRARPTLYVFVAEEDAPLGRPSYNPSCLKWQTILRIAGVDVDIVPSNNHASPSGALPFLLPPSSPSSKSPPAALTGDKIYEYARQHATHKLPDIASGRLEAYQALLTQSIRPAWLHALYIIPANAPLLAKLYLPSSIFLRAPLHHTLHAAATAEILKTTRQPYIDSQRLYADAVIALQALSTLLGEHDWFFAAPGPGLFDADVFSYTYLMLDDLLAWQDSALGGCLGGFGNLMKHRERLYARCWGDREQSLTSKPK